MPVINLREKQYRVKIDIGLPSGFEKIMALAVNDVKDLFPNQIAAIQTLAQMGQSKWRGYASGKETLPDGHTLKTWSGTYASSIQLRRNPDGYTIYSDDPKAHVIEEGASAWDYKKVLQTSHKARISKSGSLYLIIPFRHGTPNTIGLASMPEDVYELMVQKEQSHITGTKTEPSVHDPNVAVQRNTYKWGGRLTLDELEDLGYDSLDQGTHNMVNMVRMNTGNDFHISSMYMTFRTVSENSPAGSWIMPEREGHYVAETVAVWLENEYPKLMDKAVQLDVERIKALIG